MAAARCTPAVNFASNALPWNHGSDVFVTTCFKCASHRWDALQIPGAIDINAKPERITTWPRRWIHQCFHADPQAHCRVPTIVVRGGCTRTCWRQYQAVIGEQRGGAIGTTTAWTHSSSAFITEHVRERRRRGPTAPLQEGGRGLWVRVPESTKYPFREQVQGCRKSGCTSSRGVVVSRN